MSNVPADLLYTKEHEWVRIEGDEAVVGITAHAEKSLGDVVYLELPEIGSIIRRAAPLGVVESVKAVSDIFAPLTGKVLLVNQEAINNPELINEQPYDKGWLLRLSIDDKAEVSSLLSHEKYRELLRGA